MKTNRTSLLLLALCSTAAVTFARELDLGSPIGRTPYDGYLGPMWRVLGSCGGKTPSTDEVAQLVRQSNSFRYFYDKSNPYVPQTPEQTEATKAGDCKAKSLWLADKMDSRKVRFVVGKSRLSSPMSHAWLFWQGPEGWLVLDPTNNSRPLNPERLSSSELVPTFSYAPGGGRYGHSIAAAAKKGKYGDHM